MCEFRRREVGGFGARNTRLLLFFLLHLLSRLKNNNNKSMVRKPPNNLHCKMTIVIHSITRKALLISSDHRNQYSGVHK